MVCRNGTVPVQDKAADGGLLTGRASCSMHCFHAMAHCTKAACTTSRGTMLRFSQCHRKGANGDEAAHPVNAIAYHPVLGTFATGGGDGCLHSWDGAARKRICQLAMCGRLRAPHVMRQHAVLHKPSMHVR